AQRVRAARYALGLGCILGHSDVAENTQVSRSNLPLLDPDQIPITLDLHAAPSQRSDREIDERRRHERAQDFEAEAAVEPWRDEQQRGGELARRVPGDLALAAPTRSADRHREASAGPGR